MVGFSKFLGASLSSNARATTEAGGPARRSKKMRRNAAKTIDAKLDLGERIYEFLTLEITEGQVKAYADALIKDEAHGTHKAVLPYGFWLKFYREDLTLISSPTRRIQGVRALHEYMRANHAGCKTRVAERGSVRRGACRPSNVNAQKALGIDQLLLDFFVDEVQSLHLRGDSTLMMNHARELRARLVEQGYPEADLPKLIGAAGKSWFLRWRKRHGIAYKQLGMRLKVSWRKVKNRVKVLLGNIFRLRTLWELVHPGKPMHWFSADQKPSWFNNAGHTGTWAKKGSQPTVREDFAATRERYTILTTVEIIDGQDAPYEYDFPHVAVLFKGKPNGRIASGIANQYTEPNFMMIQVQEKGSYRSQDVVEFLDKALPDATTPEESIVVILDWFSGHLTDEVYELVARKGHVLLFHGGGTTPFTQVNDTHLHALVQRIMVQLEVQSAHSQQKASAEEGERKTPKMKRWDILKTVETMWRSIDHEGHAKKGYHQTGPTMPLRGPLAREDVWKDLLTVWDEIDPCEDLDGVGTSIRDEAVSFVEKGFAEGRLTTWADAPLVIEEQDDEDDPLPEGLEAFSPDYFPDDSDDEDDDDDGDIADQDGAAEDTDDGDDDDAPPPPPPEEPPPEEEDLDVPPPPPSEEEDASKDSNALKCEEARLILMAEAKRRRDDRTLQQLRKFGKVDTGEKKRAESETGVLLRKRAQEEADKAAKRRKELQEERRLAANEEEARKQETAKAQERVAAVKYMALEKLLENKKAAEKQREESAKAKEHSRWLQTVFPAMVAAVHITDANKMSPACKRTLEKSVRSWLAQGFFKRILYIPDLWTVDNSLLISVGQVQEPAQSRRSHGVRCSGTLWHEIQKLHGGDHVAGPPNPLQGLIWLLKAFVPHHKDVFAGAYSPLCLLHANDYVIDKAFIYAIVALSKWLGKERWPHGIYNAWPPKPGEELG